MNDEGTFTSCVAVMGDSVAVMGYSVPLSVLHFLFYTIIFGMSGSLPQWRSLAQV